MKRGFVTLGLLAAVCGSASADGPRISFGAASDPITLPQRDGTCQYGFTDYVTDWGYTLDTLQQLGIQCPIGPTTITRVGFFCSFITVPGSCDIVIQDDGVEVSRTTVVPVEGVNEFDIPDAFVNGTACIVLCPIAPFSAATGEDNQSFPYGNCYWSNSCACSHAFILDNLTIWAVYGDATPVESVTWGMLRYLFK
jgi:hypothetical protein